MLFYSHLTPERTRCAARREFAGQWPTLVPVRPTWLVGGANRSTSEFDDQLFGLMCEITSDVQVVAGQTVYVLFGNLLGSGGVALRPAPRTSRPSTSKATCSRSGDAPPQTGSKSPQGAGLTCGVSIRPLTPAFGQKRTCPTQPRSSPTRGCALDVAWPPPRPRPLAGRVNSQRPWLTTDRRSVSGSYSLA